MKPALPNWSLALECITAIIREHLACCPCLRHPDLAMHFRGLFNPLISVAGRVACALHGYTSSKVSINGVSSVWIVRNSDLNEHNNIVASTNRREIVLLYSHGGPMQKAS
jgi:hypothetical protein